MRLLPRWCVVSWAGGLRHGTSFELGGRPARRLAEAEGMFIPRVRRPKGWGGVLADDRVLGQTRRAAWLSRQRITLRAPRLAHAEGAQTGVMP
jgi:hypothetical protein